MKHAYCKYLLPIYMTVLLAKTNLVCTSDFANLRLQNAFRKKYKAKTLSNNEGMYDQQTLQILTCFAAPKKYYEPFK